MFLTVFHEETRRIFHGKRGKKSRFGHMFGGAADYFGLSTSKRRPPVHLLFRLNTEDPAVGVTLPGVQWLPLLCAIRYGACALGYRVVSDEEVKILRQAEKKPWKNYPDDGYLEKLPVQPILFKKGSYDPDNVEDVLGYAGVFGYGALTPKQYARVLRFLKKKRLAELFDCESAEALLEEGGALPGLFDQGPPVEDCPDPTCENHGREASLQTFLIFVEGWIEAQTLWGPNSEIPKIIYQICPKCGAISTSSQTT